MEFEQSEASPALDRDALLSSLPETSEEEIRLGDLQVPVGEGLPSIELFTDGGCSPNPGPGGWAFILRPVGGDAEMSLEHAGAVRHSTNNRMELMAVIRGLLSLDRPCRVRIVSDSEYVIKGLTEWIDGWKRAKYKLLHTIRQQDVSQDSYECVYQEEDEMGNRGISLSKNITHVAGRALTKNLTSLGPLILPFREIIKVLFTTAARSTLKFFQKKCGMFQSREVEVHIPDFKKAVEHFCIHAGGRAVIEGIKQNLKLTDKQVTPTPQA